MDQCINRGSYYNYEDIPLAFDSCLIFSSTKYSLNALCSFLSALSVIKTNKML